MLIRRQSRGSQTAGPSRTSRSPARPQFGLDEENYRPPDDYVPKYENNATMTYEERLATYEVRALLIVLSLKDDCKRLFNQLSWDE